jgi:hypothetical protein
MLKDHLGNLGIDERIILKYILQKEGRITGLGSSGLWWGPVADSSEHANEPSDEGKDRGVLNELRN